MSRSGVGEDELRRPIAQHPIRQHPIREQDQYMPIANVIRIMRRILPSHAKISDDAKETIQECVSEYISFVTGEANDRCQREQRKTITAEDVLWAMGKLGFDNYVGPLSLYLHRYREIETDRGSSLRCEVPPFLRQAAAAADFGHGVIGRMSYNNLNDSSSGANTGNLPFGSMNYYASIAGDYYGDGAGSSVPVTNASSGSVSNSSQDVFSDLVHNAKFN